MISNKTFGSLRGRAMGIWFCLATALGLGVINLTAGEPEPGPLPKVVLLGDSIRLGYTPVVEKELAGKIVLVSPKANGGDSSNLLKHLDDWAIREQPAVVHFNCGIHDTKKSKATGKFQVSPEQYEANLRKIVERLRKETKATIVFATTTPILDERAAKTRTKAEYELLERSVVQYNEIAKRVMQDLKVPVNDLHGLLGDGEKRAQLMSSDGVHFTTPGRETLGKAVAQSLTKHLPAKEK